MDSSPPKPQPQSANAQDFIPEKISFGRRRARSVGSCGSAGEIVLLTDSINDGGAGQRLDNLHASQPPAIASSVVFHEDTGLDSLDETDASLVDEVDSEGVGTAQTVAASSSADPKDSNRGDGQQQKRDSVCKLFDEIDELFPHNHEGGKIVSDPHLSNNNCSTLISSLGNSLNSNSSSLSMKKSMTSSILENLRNSKLVNSDDPVPTDYESLVVSSNDGTLAQLIAGIEDRYRRSTTLSQLSSMDINLGNEEGANINVSSGNPTQDNDASRRESLVGGKPPTPALNECVDWSSLTKSCKRAKVAFRDEDSGQMVVKNMFVAHLGALIAVMERHCGSSDPMDNDGSNNSDEGNQPCTWNEIKARTIETKRALRFAIMCLVPPRVEEDPKSSNGGTEEGQGSVPTTGPSEAQDGVELTGSSEVQDDVDVYEFARRYRQELQEAAVRGISSRPPSPMRDRDTNRRTEPRHYGLQLPLVEIIIADKTFMEDDANISASCGDKDKHDALIMSKIEREKRTVRILASRLLCNLVTDNPLAAEIILRDVPFSPTPDQVDGRMAGLILEPRDSASKTFMNENEAIFWCDLLDATAKVQKVDTPVESNGKGKQPDANNSEDREALAAVAAALHNLLTSLEAGESLLEVDDEMDRRENSNHHQEEFISEIEIENRPTKTFDVGFEAASNGPLMNALLRNILPAKAVLMQSKYEKEHTTASRPKFKPSTPLVAADNMSDSATEWISLVLERVASRGLLPQMFRTAGGATDAVTPEQVVLASCIRQAVDDYHSLTPARDAGGFGRRRLSIAVKTSGMSVTTRPHPLWGRAAHHGKDSRTAVPVLLALANEVGEVRLRANALREGKSNEVYDGELNCSIRIIDDICDILAQSLGRHASSAVNATDNQRNKLCFIADSRSVLGRETTLISSCCKDLARILDAALARNSGRKAREMELSPQDQQTAIVMVRLIANITYQCCYNQDLLRITPVPIADFAYDTPASSNNAADTHSNAGSPIERTGLHVVLSATSLSPACFTLREWCIIAIRNAVEGNAANAETVRRLEGNEVMGDTPELQRMGVKVEMDKKGNVHVKKRDS